MQSLEDFHPLKVHVILMVVVFV